MYSNHPIAKAIVRQWKTNDRIQWNKVEEIKGLGVKATDNQGNTYLAGSYKLISEQGVSSPLSEGEETGVRLHNIYVSKNNKLLGWIDLADEVRPEATTVISYFKSHNIKTIL